MLEGSVFNGREPDQHRWDIEFGKLGLRVGRLWVQAVSELGIPGVDRTLKKPEELEPGNIERTTASASWTKQEGPEMTALHRWYERERDGSTALAHAFLAEMTRRRGPLASFGGSNCYSRRPPFCWGTA